MSAPEPQCTCVTLKPTRPWVSAVVRHECPVHTDQLAEAELEAKGLGSVTFVVGDRSRSSWGETSP